MGTTSETGTPPIAVRIRAHNAYERNQAKAATVHVRRRANGKYITSVQHTHTRTVVIIIRYCTGVCCTEQNRAAADRDVEAVAYEKPRACTPVFGFRGGDECN